MNTKLITALRTSAKAIESGTIDYNWLRPSRCNCGVLACALMGRSPNKLNVPTYEGARGWRSIVGQHCPITGIPEHETIRAFYNAGLVQKDIIDLEMLSNPEVLARCDFGLNTVITRRWFITKPAHVAVKPNYQDGKHVVIYMRAWADLLTEQGAMDVAQPESEPAKV